MNVRPSAANNFVGESLDVIGATPRVDNLANGRFVLNVKLRVAGDTCAEVRGQGNSFVEGVGV